MKAIIITLETKDAVSEYILNKIYNELRLNLNIDGSTIRMQVYDEDDLSKMLVKNAFIPAGNMHIEKLEISEEVLAVESAIVYLKGKCGNPTELSTFQSTVLSFALKMCEFDGSSSTHRSRSNNRFYKSMKILAEANMNNPEIHDIIVNAGLKYHLKFIKNVYKRMLK